MSDWDKEKMADELMEPGRLLAFTKACVARGGALIGERDALKAELAEAVRLLRYAEWRGSGGRCPWCYEWPAITEKDIAGGHGTDCEWVAFLAKH